MTFLTILEVPEILCSFKLVLEGITGKEIPESARLEFLEKFSANNFALESTVLNPTTIHLFTLLLFLISEDNYGKLELSKMSQE